jgi:hypothetical protein
MLSPATAELVKFSSDGDRSFLDAVTQLNALAWVA